MAKVNAQNWPQLDFLINNFYEIIEYKRGRGVYGDRVVLRRPRHAAAIFGEQEKLFEFYYMDANAVKELPRTVQEKINIITRMITSPEDMNVLCNFNNAGVLDPNTWAVETKNALAQAKTLNFATLNTILVERYKLLDEQFLQKLKQHRQKQYFLASNEEFDLLSKEYVAQKLKEF